MTSSCKGTASPGLVHSIHSLHVLLTWYTSLMDNFQSTHANARCCQSQGILLACCWHDPLHYKQTLSVLRRSCYTLGCLLQRTHATITQTLGTGLGQFISNISLFIDTWLKTIIYNPCFIYVILVLMQQYFIKKNFGMPLNKISAE